MDDIPISSNLQPTLLTVGEASDVMLQLRCRYTSNRKVQRMCREGAIVCEKITTTRDGNPVTEWLVDRASLLKQIEMHEPRWPDGESLFLMRSSNTGRADRWSADQSNLRQVGEAAATQSPAATGDDTATPSQGGGASPVIGLRRRHTFAPIVMTSSKVTGDAAGGAGIANGGANSSDDMATPDEAGDAIGEPRSLADVLIDNAKLTAELAGARQLIETITDEKGFLREELREARAGRKDVTAIAQRMLETLETIAIGGKLISPASSFDPVSTEGAYSAYQDPHQPGAFAPKWRPGDNPNSQNGQVRL